MTQPKKTPEQMANEHWSYQELLILTCLKLTMRVALDNFMHGFKHGKESKDGVRTRPRKES